MDSIHRHHQKPQGHKFSIGVQDETGRTRGVAIVGRPVARCFDDGLTVEVTRVATDGTPNACSALYGAAWKAASGMGCRMDHHVHAGRRVGCESARGRVAPGCRAFAAEGLGRAVAPS